MRGKKITIIITRNKLTLCFQYRYKYAVQFIPEPETNKLLLL